MSRPPTVRTADRSGVAALRTPPTQRRHPALRDSDRYETLNAKPDRGLLVEQPPAVDTADPRT
jgi:hypothetical protein